MPRNDGEEMRLMAKIIDEEANIIPDAYEAQRWFFFTCAGILRRFAEIAETE